jgi:hypothetical protein
VKRNIIILVIITLFVILGGLLGVRRIEERWDRFRREAGVHAEMEEKYRRESDDFSRVTNDPDNEADLALALYQSGVWSREMALSVEVDRFSPQTHSQAEDRRKQELQDRMRLLALEEHQRLRKLSIYHLTMKYWLLNRW